MKLIIKANTLIVSFIFSRPMYSIHVLEILIDLSNFMLINIDFGLLSFG